MKLTKKIGSAIIGLSLAITGAIVVPAISAHAVESSVNPSSVTACEDGQSTITLGDPGTITLGAEGFDFRSGWRAKSDFKISGTPSGNYIFDIPIEGQDYRNVNSIESTFLFMSDTTFSDGVTFKLGADDYEFGNGTKFYSGAKLDYIINLSGRASLVVSRGSVDFYGVNSFESSFATVPSVALTFKSGSSIDFGDGLYGYNSGWGSLTFESNVDITRSREFRIGEVMNIDSDIQRARIFYTQSDYRSTAVVPLGREGICAGEIFTPTDSLGVGKCEYVNNSPITSVGIIQGSGTVDQLEIDAPYYRDDRVSSPRPDYVINNANYASIVCMRGLTDEGLQYNSYTFIGTITINDTVNEFVTCADYDRGRLSALAFSDTGHLGTLKHRGGNIEQPITIGSNIDAVEITKGAKIAGVEINSISDITAEMITDIDINSEKVTIVDNDKDFDDDQSNTDDNQGEFDDAQNGIDDNVNENGTPSYNHNNNSWYAPSFGTKANDAIRSAGSDPEAAKRNIDAILTSVDSKSKTTLLEVARAINQAKTPEVAAVIASEILKHAATPELREVLLKGLVESASNVKAKTAVAVAGVKLGKSDAEKVKLASSAEAGAHTLSAKNAITTALVKSVKNSLKDNVAVAAVRKAKNAWKDDVAVSAVQAANRSTRIGVAKASVKASSKQARANVAKAVTKALPRKERKATAKAIYKATPKTERTAVRKALLKVVRF